MRALIELFESIKAYKEAKADTAQAKVDHKKAMQQIDEDRKVFDAKIALHDAKMAEWKRADAEAQKLAEPLRARQIQILEEVKSLPKAGQEVRLEGLMAEMLENSEKINKSYLPVPTLEL